MARKYLPFIPTFVYQSSFDSFRKIADVQSPKLHFHSRSDEVIPFELGKKLYDNGPDPREFVMLEGGHNDSFIVSQKVFLSKIDDFIGRL